MLENMKQILHYRFEDGWKLLNIYKIRGQTFLVDNDSSSRITDSKSTFGHSFHQKNKPFVLLINSNYLKHGGGEKAPKREDKYSKVKCS